MEKEKERSGAGWQGTGVAGVGARGLVRKTGNGDGAVVVAVGGRR